MVLRTLIKNVPLLALLIALSNTYGFGQEPSTSTLKCEYLNGYWVLSIKAQNSMASSTLKAADPALDLSELGVRGYHDLYKSYLSEHLTLVIDGDTLPLNFVALEMNSAKANGQFISERLSAPGTIIGVKSDAFSILGKHSTKLNVILDDEKHSLWLNADNNFEGRVKLKH
ncbi:MAG: hypothetical protein Salg2KO_07960 [Salibacteraceae bacterium]